VAEASQFERTKEVYDKAPECHFLACDLVPNRNVPGPWDSYMWNNIKNRTFKEVYVCIQGVCVCVCVCVCVYLTRLYSQHGLERNVHGSLNAGFGNRGKSGIMSVTLS
jgi:hypothetical protein